MPSHRSFTAAAAGLALFMAMGTPALASKYKDTGEVFASVDQLLEICRAVTPGVTTIDALTQQFGGPQNQLKRPGKGRTWFTWRAGDPVIQIIIWYDGRSGIVEAASGKYQYHNKGQWLWANTENVPVAERCVLQDTVYQHSTGG